MYLGDYSESIAYLEEAIFMAEALDDQSRIAHTLINLASSVELAGDPDRGDELLQQSIDLHKQSGDIRGLAYAIYLRGHVQRKLGNVAQAKELLDQALPMLEEVGQMDAVALCLEALAGVDVDRGQFEFAGDNLAAAAALRESLGLPVPRPRLSLLDTDTSAIKENIGAEALDQKINRALSARTSNSSMLTSMANYYRRPQALLDVSVKSGTPLQ